MNATATTTTTAQNDAARKARWAASFSARHEGTTRMNKGTKMVLRNGVWTRA